MYTSVPQMVLSETVTSASPGPSCGRGTTYIEESASLAEAIACMAKTHARVLPVVGPQGQVVGLLADTDALRWVAAHHAT
jgi:CBS domain-containing protein